MFDFEEYRNNRLINAEDFAIEMENRELSNIEEDKYAFRSFLKHHAKRLDLKYTLNMHSYLDPIELCFVVSFPMYRIPINKLFTEKSTDKLSVLGFFISAVNLIDYLENYEYEMDDVLMTWNDSLRDVFIFKNQHYRNMLRIELCKTLLEVIEDFEIENNVDFQWVKVQYESIGLSLSINKHPTTEFSNLYLQIYFKNTLTEKEKFINWKPGESIWRT